MVSRPRIMSLMLPRKSDLRSVYLRDQGERFLEKDPGTKHYSPSGLTAILFAERALAAGRSVTIKIYPHCGAVLTLGGDRLDETRENSKQESEQ